MTACSEESSTLPTIAPVVQRNASINPQTGVDTSNGSSVSCRIRSYSVNGVSSTNFNLPVNLSKGNVLSLELVVENGSGAVRLVGSSSSALVPLQASGLTFQATVGGLSGTANLPDVLSFELTNAGVRCSNSLSIIVLPFVGAGSSTKPVVTGVSPNTADPEKLGQGWMGGTYYLTFWGNWSREATAVQMQCKDRLFSLGIYNEASSDGNLKQLTATTNFSNSTSNQQDNWHFISSIVGEKNACSVRIQAGGEWSDYKTFSLVPSTNAGYPGGLSNYYVLLGSYGPTTEVEVGATCIIDGAEKSFGYLGSNKGISDIQTYSTSYQVAFQYDSVMSGKVCKLRVRTRNAAKEYVEGPAFVATIP